MQQFADRFHSFIEKVGMIFLVIMILIVSMQVGTRLTIKTTPRWAEEVSSILMVWFGFLGIAIGVKEKIHIAITYFVDRLRTDSQKVVLIINEVLILFYGVSLLWYGSKLIYVTRTSTLPATQWPAYTPYLIVPVAGAMVILYSIIHLKDLLDNKISYGAEGEV